MSRFLFLAFIFLAVLAHGQREVRRPMKSGALNQKSFKETFSYRVMVNDSLAFAHWARKNPAAKIHHYPRTHIFTISRISLKNLEALPFLSFIDVGDRKAVEERTVESLDLAPNTINTVHGLYPHLSGQDITVSVKEKPFDTTDIDFRKRYVNSSHFDEGPTTHATTIATIIGGGGNSSYQSKGVIWGAYLTTSDFFYLLPDDVQQLKNESVSVQNHSYGVGIENYYGIESQAYDKAVQDYPELIHVFSAGNAGTETSEDGPYRTVAGFANLTGQFKMSKNTISVGSTDQQGMVSPRSSRGPAFDGRVKPELVAFGDAGSSESAAYVSGIAGLVQQAYREQTGSLPPSSLVKAALINSADDAGRPHVDFENGYGVSDALGAVQTVLENRFFTGDLVDQEEKIFPITIPSLCRSVSVTLVWNDHEGNVNTEKALINDLDLRVRNVSTGEETFPWVLNNFPHIDSLQKPAARKQDHLNNVEQVTLSSPSPGLYHIHIVGYDIPQGPQPFAVVFEFNQGFRWTFPVANEKLIAGKKYLLRWKNFTAEESATLEYKFSGDDHWTIIENSVDLNKGFFEWTPPDTLNAAQLRMVTTTNSFLTDEFMLTPILQTTVGFFCEEETMVHWPSVPHAEAYEVYQLGAKYLEPITTVTDTMVILTTSMNKSYFAVAPIANARGERSVTLNYAQQGVGCYFKSFLPREFVTDSVIFDVELSSTYQVEDIILQRWNGSAFYTVQSLPSTSSREYSFSDRSATPGKNIFRAGVLLSSQNEKFSQEEEVFLVDASDVLVFPNPIKSGDDLSLVLEQNEPVTVEFIDTLGRLVFKTTEEAELISIPAPAFPGSYILRITSTARSWFSRIVIY